MAEDQHGIIAKLELAGEAWDVVQAELTEALDELGSLEARLSRDGALPRPATLLAAEVSFELTRADRPDEPRRFRGIVVEAERHADASGRPYLRILARPKLFRATLRTGCRTFQQKTSVDAVTDVLGRAGVEPIRSQVRDQLPKRDYLVQYRETDWDFVRRVLAEDGVALQVDHDGDATEIVLFDDPSGLGEATDPTLPYRPEFGFDQPFASISKVARRDRVVFDKVTLRDYDFERPRLDLTSSAEGTDDGAHALEVYAFPGRATDQAELARRAQLLLDARQSRRDVLSAATTSWRLLPGRRFELAEHPADALNTEYLALSSRVRFDDVRTGTGEEKHRVSVDIEAIPTERSRYRPARQPRARVLPGPQLGKTTGPSGQEVHVDGHGRVKGRFFWDREAPDDDTSSLWMRTAQLPTGGSMLLPRVGWEVLVSCTEGDPDLPLVMSRLTNAETPPPYALPKHAARSALQTATTPGGGSSNELRTDDSKGKEEMLWNASKDMTIDVLNNTTESVGNDATLKVGSNQTVHVTNSVDVVVGADQSISVSGNRSTKVSTFLVDDCADHSLSVGGNRDMKVGGDHKHTVGGGSKLDVGSLSATAIVGKASETVGGNVTFDVGAAEVALTAGSISREIGGDLSRSVGAIDAVIAFGGKSSDVSGNVQQMVGGAVLAKVDADHAETSGATYTEVAGGASIVKADNVTFEADAMITLVMGASILTINPAMVAILGTSVKVDGDTAETNALVIDN